MKQANKKHKTGGHAGKRAIRQKIQGAGRVETGRGGVKAGMAAQQSNGKDSRANRAKQLQQQKRRDLLVKRRVGKCSVVRRLCGVRCGVDIRLP